MKYAQAERIVDFIHIPEEDRGYVLTSERARLFVEMSKYIRANNDRGYVLFYTERDLEPEEYDKYKINILAFHDRGRDLDTGKFTKPVKLLILKLYDRSTDQ